MSRGLRLAFVAGLSDKKLQQKLTPLALLPEVERIDLYRRAPSPPMEKVRQISLPLAGKFLALEEMGRAAALFAGASEYDCLIGCFQLYHGVFAHLAGLVWRIPVVQMVITDVDWNMARPLARWAMLAADACAVRGPASRDKLLAAGYRRPVAVVHNPLGITENAPLSAASKRYDLIAVGDAAVEKDYPLLLRTLARLRALRPGLRALMCGRGFDGPLRALASELGLQDAVEFAGHLGPLALAEAYAASLGLILTSQVEGLPMVAVEAMLAGLPVFVTAVGELPWLVRDNREGLVFSDRNPDAMALRLAQTLQDAPVLAAMSQAARRRILGLRDEFSTRAVAQVWRGLLTSVGVVPDDRGRAAVGL